MTKDALTRSRQRLAIARERMRQARGRERHRWTKAVKDELRRMLCIQERETAGDSQ